MSDQTIFGKDNSAGTPPANTATQSTDDVSATLLQMIVNEEGKQKYQNVQEALKGAAHAQAYIADLKRQLDEAKSIAAANTASKEKQDELERTVQALLEKSNQSSTSANSEPALDPTKIAELVEQTLNRKTAAQQAEANQAIVVNELTKVFGDKAEEKYKAAAQELGMSTADLDVWSAKSPKAVLKALGVEAKAVHTPSFAPPASAVNTAGFQPNQDSFVKKNTVAVSVGATTQDLHAEAQRAKQMVNELHANGMEVGDLADPKQFFKYFK